jgi:hypothetical protein
MSHRPERKEKNCLNCGAIVQGKFCHICGQENVEPKETFWGMVTHFFYDITHFDGKFFVTLKDLLFRPGFLSLEYMKGKRMSYLNPIRMYIFTSAVFFLIFFSLTGGKSAFKWTEGNEPLSLGARDSLVRELQEDLKDDTDLFNINKQIALLKDTSKQVTPVDLIPFAKNFTLIGTLGYDYKSKKEYDSLQSAWPADKKDNWFKRLWNKKAIQLNEKYKTRGALSMEKLSDSVLHRLPYLLFVSLPFFALILKWLYIRRKKEFYYADHGIFTIHHYILSFILLLFIFLWDKMNDVTGWGFWNFLVAVTVIAWPVYLYLAMKRFYKQDHAKTFLKFLLLNITAFIVMIVLLVFFFLFSVFQL